MKQEDQEVMEQAKTVVDQTSRLEMVVTNPDLLAWQWTAGCQY